MAIEIERKFLLADDAWRGEVERSTRMAQGYLGGERASVRVRIAGDEAHLNIKARRRGAARAEFEYAIPVDDAAEILDQLSLPGRVEKTRHHVRYAGMLWEIDEFHGENDGLIVAEVELDAADQAFEHPPWLGAEVTDKLRYYNAHLLNHPFASWSDEERRNAC